jgi:DNA-binding transcriptional regulator/RsmH inhibitor MraZ
MDEQLGYMRGEPYTVKVSKGRIGIPEKLKRGDIYFFVNHATCLAIFPERFYNQLDMSYLERAQPDNPERLAHFTGDEAVLDNKGRLQVPVRLRRQYKLPDKGLVNLLQSGNCFVIKPFEEKAETPQA